uniref:Peroxiredoxin n=1 Tax=Candidatus Kentrum eta TaxID=2126337 RepID=A0A450UKU7_9GAMM|nr:MAG: Peroxiredoxin [Candidatus Kentron sp. H]VFJ93158.1 MAG: Peroxiredoxin [Candidatus Kentron sp. H]VFK00007.1 MAG: Peroxiredoxin [Candidatus Kentron sp. H]
MATASTMLELGTAAPDFSLPDTNGKRVSRGDFQDYAGFLVVFLCNHCPYVHHIRQALVAFAGEYQPRGLAMVAINANDPLDYPEDSPDKMVEEAANFGYTFPYLFDETQEVAKAYRAACTPDFFLFDKGRKLIYRGQFDDSRPKNRRPVTGRDLRAAAEALLSGQAMDPDQKASVGCNIKWRAGNEPDYFRSIRLKPNVGGSLGLETGAPRKGRKGRRTGGAVPGEATPAARARADAMPLDSKQLEKLSESVCAHMDDWLTGKDLTGSPAAHDIALQKQITHLEEELQHQQASIKQGFDLMEKRLGAMDKRLEAADKRSETLDKRLDGLTQRMDRFLTRSMAVTVAVGFIVILILRACSA